MFILIFVSLVSCIFAFLIFGRTYSHLNTPPVFCGVPIIGGLYKFSMGPLKLIDEGYKKFGEIFTVPVINRKITFLIGPDVVSHFFKAPDSEMSQDEVYGFNVPTFGRDVVFDVNPKIRAEQFKMLSEALRIKKMNDYIPLFVTEAEAYIKNWGKEGTVNLVEEFSELVLLTASRTLLGREVREQMFDEVKDLLHDLDAGLTPLTVFFPYLPTKLHKARDMAREKLAKIFKEVIECRRQNVASSQKESDMMQVLLDSKYTNVDGGRLLKDHEITGLLIATIFAGQHTSSISASWTGYFAIHNKEVMSKLLLEQNSVIENHGSNLSGDALSEMSYLHCCIQESIRLHPPLILLLRYVHKNFDVQTSTGKVYTIPKGHIVATSPAFSHRLDSSFSEPNSFKPERFQEDESGHKPFTYIGFGGGRHGCMGTNFAYLQIKVIWSVLLRNFEFQVVDPFPKPNLDGMVVSPHACRVHYRRRSLV